MKTMRLVVAGTPGAGKSTFVRTISEIEVVDTDRTATDETAMLKQKTTVAFDYGRISFGSSMELQIYGTPGQSRFSFMWDFLIQRAHIYILLVAAHRPNDFHYARQIVSFMNQRVQIPMIVGLTHTDCPGASTPEEIMIRLGYMNDRNRPHVVKVNPKERASVTEAVMASMALLIARCNIDQPTKTGETRQSTQPTQQQSRSTYPLSASQFSRGY
jgi:signal recognition particle receptor subunit beta